MATLDDLFPSPWLKAEDFAEGEEKRLTIKGWTKSELPSKNGAKPKLSLDLTFVETEKTFGANFTNREAIAKILGRDPNDWIGKPVTFMTMWVDSYGETVRAVRVKPTQAAPVPSHAATREDRFNELKAIREKIKGINPDLLPAKPTADQLAGEGLDAVLAAHSLVLEALKVEAL